MTNQSTPVVRTKQGRATMASRSLPGGGSNAAGVFLQANADGWNPEYYEPLSFFYDEEWEGVPGQIQIGVFAHTDETNPTRLFFDKSGFYFVLGEVESWASGSSYETAILRAHIPSTLDTVNVGTAAQVVTSSEYSSIQVSGVWPFDVGDSLDLVYWHSTESGRDTHSRVSVFRVADYVNVDPWYSSGGG